LSLTLGVEVDVEIEVPRIIVQMLFREVGAVLRKHRCGTKEG